jgi:WD40 repeat protein/class 3 adenylate cyclase
MLVFFFTDIEGSTRLWEEHTATMTDVIARHDALLQGQIEACGGHITKHTGDGVTAAFGDGEPIGCALETQKRFAAERWGAIGELRIRIGMHAGEAEFHAGDYFGPPVNCTARIMSAAWGGQILLTPQVSSVASLPPGASLLDLGEHLLKDVRAPQPIFQLLHPDLPRADFPPLRTLSGRGIKQAVDERGAQLAGLKPLALATTLVVATLLPTLQDDPDPDSPALAANLGVLADLGADDLRRFTADFAQQLRARRLAGEALAMPAIQSQLEGELFQSWATSGALRADASRLLQAVQGVDATMSAATREVREALARGLADLAGSFGEFRWMLVGVQETLAEVRARQALQLALQREQLDLQRQQLVKTNLLLQRQHEGAPPVVADMEVEEDHPPADVACPYKGLAAFEAEDNEFFFGREKLVAELTARLAGTRFLAVVGPSGCGKSSVVRAGLLPAIWGNTLPGSAHWQTLVLTPGAHPLEELAVRLSLLPGIEAGASALHEALENHPQALHLTVRQALADASAPGGEPDDARLLLVVDQFEEVFALCHDEAERRGFIDALLCAVEAEGARIVVVPTIRADFYGRCADYPKLAAQLADNMLVGPLGEGDLRAVIERPAEVVGLRLEPGLADTLVGDVAGEPGALPLLSHALLETWQRRRGRTLTLEGYAAAGGVSGAIAQTADTVYDAFSPDEKAVARGIFLRLTELGEEGTQDTRRRVAPRELVRTPEEAPVVASVLKTLADARLITTGGGPALSGAEGPLPRESERPVPSIAEGTVEVAHEALIREWPTLRRWLEEDREGLRIHRHLTEAALEWERLERPADELYRGARLAAAVEWQASHSEALNPLEREFLEASLELAEREERERQRRRRRTIVGLVAGLVIALVLALLAGQQWQRARAEEQTALRQASVLLASQAEAELEAGYGDRAVLLALEALERFPYTSQAEHALGQAVSYNRALQQYTGHESAVTSLAWSPDGTRVASSASVDNRVDIWDPVTGETETVIEMPIGITGNKLDMALHVRWTSDGKRLLTITGDRYRLGSQDYDVLLWDAASGELLSSVEVANQAAPESGDMGTSFVNYTTGSLADIAPESGRLATAGGDNTAILWDAAWQGPETVLRGHWRGVNSVDWSPDEAKLVTASLDGTARIWDARSGEALQVLEGHDGRVHLALWSPDGARVATAGEDGTLRIWDAADGALVSSIQAEGGEVWSLAWAPEGQRIVSGEGDGSIRIREAASGAQLELLRGHEGIITDLKWSPVDDRLVSGDGNGTARIWNAAPSTAWRLYPPQAERGGDWTVQGADWSSDGRYLSMAGGDIVEATDPPSFNIWDVEANELLMESLGDALGYNGAQVAFSPDDSAILYTGYEQFPDLSGLATAYVFDAKTGDITQTFTPDGEDLVTGLAWSPSGNQVATGLFSGGIMIWDVQTGNQVTRLPPDAANTFGDPVQWSPDGSKFAAGVSVDLDFGAVRVWDASTWEELFVVRHEHPAYINALDWSPDGKYLLTGSGNDEEGAKDHTARIWDGETGEEVLVFHGHSMSVWPGDWSPNGERIVTSSNDGTVKIWSASTGDELLTLLVPVGYGLVAFWSPDGQHLAVVGHETLVSVWRVWQSTEELVEYAKECCAFRELTAAERERFALPPR